MPRYMIQTQIAAIALALLILPGQLAAQNAATASVYREETVHFDNRGVRLEATLYLPDRKGEMPGIVLVHGSGPNPRDRFQTIARQLAGAGYAVLNYDKRGVGGSTGVYPEKFTPAALEQLSGDASAALSFLAKRPEVRKDGLGFWGVSQAGWVVPRAVKMNRRASFMLLVSAPATSLYDVEKYQRITQLREPADGLTADQADAKAAQLANEFDFPNVDATNDLRNIRIPGLWLIYISACNGLVYAPPSVLQRVQPVTSSSHASRRRRLHGPGWTTLWCYSGFRPSCLRPGCRVLCRVPAPSAVPSG